MGYDWVEEYILDDEDDTSTIRYNFYNDSESDKFDDNFPDSPAYVNYTNGLVKSIEKYGTKDTGPHTLVEKEDFEYTSTYSSIIKAFRDRGQKKLDDDLLSYYYKIEWPLKTKATKTFKTDDEKSIVTETNYTYNTKDLLKSTSYTVDNVATVEKVKYPFEFTDAVNAGLTAKNMVGLPIETITLKDNSVTQASKTEYFNNSGIYLPKTIYKGEFGGTSVSESAYAAYYKPFMSFDSYGAKGKLQQFKYTGGTDTYYVWGYKNQYPIAKLENFTAANAATIQSTITAAVNASNVNTTPALENTLRTALTNLRNAAPNAMVTTYTYDPLIGVTSVTDPRGYTMYYEYDVFNRLKQVKDADGKILSKNQYNYKP